MVPVDPVKPTDMEVEVAVNTELIPCIPDISAAVAEDIADLVITFVPTVGLL